MGLILGQPKAQGEAWLTCFPVEASCPYTKINWVRKARLMYVVGPRTSGSHAFRTSLEQETTSEKPAPEQKFLQDTPWRQVGAPRGVPGSDMQQQKQLLESACETLFAGAAGPSGGAGGRGLFAAPHARAGGRLGPSAPRGGALQPPAGSKRLGGLHNQAVHALT